PSATSEAAVAAAVDGAETAADDTKSETAPVLEPARLQFLLVVGGHPNAADLQVIAVWIVDVETVRGVRPRIQAAGLQNLFNLLRIPIRNGVGNMVDRDL